MKGTFWMIIFVLFNSLPNRICLHFSSGKAKYTCHIALRHHPWIRENPAIKSSELKCWTEPNIGQSGGEHCVLNILNTTQHYVHFTSQKCHTGRGKFYKFNLRCILPKEGSRYLSYFGRVEFGKLRKIFPSGVVVYFINSTALKGDRINIFNAWTRRTLTERRRSIAFICIQQNSLLGRERGGVQQRTGERIADETLHRRRRHIPMRNYTTSSAFLSYFPKITITSHPVTPPPMTSSRCLIVPSRTTTDVSDLCPRSVVVNRSTIYVTPTEVITGYAGGFIPTSKLTPVMHFTVSPMLRNYTSDALVLPSRITSTKSFILAHLVKRTKNATYMYNDRLVSVVYFAQSSAYVVSLSCATVAHRLASTQEPLCSSASKNGSPTSKADDVATKDKKLHLGLIVTGGIVLTLMFCVAMFLLVRRYRRIQALRRKAKQISYFNQFDCSSAWDEPDRFGGSKLSVFTLKNSKFDIDWESPHDTKQ